MNNSEIVGSIIEVYSNARFGLMFVPWLNKAKERIPELNCISAVSFPEDLGCPMLKCTCNDITHKIRHIFTITLSDHSVLKCGAKCLFALGYPRSLGERLDKTRRIIQRDVETIAPLAPDTARNLTSIYQTWAQTILDNKYYPGLLFLEQFGVVLNGLIECGFDLPQWLQVMLKRFYLFAVKEAPLLKSKLLNESREKYKEEFSFLNSLNENLIFGRSPWVQDILKHIDGGDKLLAWQINKIKELKKKEADDGLITKTEKALAFLVALTNGTIPLTKYDATPAKGQKSPIFLSYLEHIQKNVTLSLSQLETLRWKYKSYYKSAFNKLPLEAKMTSQELIKLARSLPAGDPQLNKITTVLLGRNVDINYIKGTP